jgi:RNA-directed DNA polymerase
VDLKNKPVHPPARGNTGPKPGTKEKRPLGIPTVCSYCTSILWKFRHILFFLILSTQSAAIGYTFSNERSLVKLALEPESEARFEPNSYGFRPGRSCHDAIEAIYNSIRSQDKYVLDADISKCESNRFLHT